jgi:hypothetical protein
MICNIPELGDEGPIVNGLATIQVTKHYKGPLTAEVWEIRPHVRLISRTRVDPCIDSCQLDPNCTLKISLAPHLLR